VRYIKEAPWEVELPDWRESVIIFRMVHLQLFCGLIDMPPSIFCCESEDTTRKHRRRWSSRMGERREMNIIFRIFCGLIDMPQLIVGCESEDITKKHCGRWSSGMGERREMNIVFRMVAPCFLN
jgi:hypothetical protein